MLATTARSRQSQFVAAAGNSRLCHADPMRQLQLVLDLVAEAGKRMPNGWRAGRSGSANARSIRRRLLNLGERPGDYVAVTVGQRLRTVRRALERILYPEATVRPAVAPIAIEQIGSAPGLRVWRAPKSRYGPSTYIFAQACRDRGARRGAYHDDFKSRGDSLSPARRKCWSWRGRLCIRSRPQPVLDQPLDHGKVALPETLGSWSKRESAGARRSWPAGRRRTRGSRSTAGAHRRGLAGRAISSCTCRTVGVSSGQVVARNTLPNTRARSEALSGGARSTGQLG